MEKVWQRGRADKRGNAILEHRIRYAKRYQLGTLYPDVAEDVVETYLKNPDLSYEQHFPGYGNYRERPRLMIDATGVGAAVRDEFLKAGIERPSKGGGHNRRRR